MQTVVQSFLGLCIAFGRFAPNFSHIAVHLNKRLRKAQPIQIKALTETKKKKVQQLN